MMYEKEKEILWISLQNYSSNDKLKEFEEERIITKKQYERKRSIGVWLIL